MKKVMRKLGENFVALALVVGVISTSQACHYFFNQPKVPEAMKKLFNVLVLSLGLALGMSSIAGAKVSDMVSLGELTDGGDKVSNAQWQKVETFDGWSHELMKAGNYVGFKSKDKKSFWINGIKISENTKEVKIPSKVNGLKVTKVGAFDFNAEYCSIFERYPYYADNEKNPSYMDGRNITSIVVPEGVTVIGQKTFAHMKNLTKIVLPKSLETLEKDIFLGDKSLKELKLGANVKNIHSSAFNGMKKLSDLSFASANKKYKTKNTMVLSKNGKKLYLVFGSKNKIKLDGKVRGIYNIETNKLTNNIGALADGIKVEVAKNNKVFASKKGFIYLRKTGELLYYSNKTKDPVLPECIKKIGNKTGWSTKYYSKLKLSKNIRCVNCKKLPLRTGYLHTIDIPGKTKIKFKNADYIDMESGITVYVKKEMKNYYNGIFNKCKYVKVKVK